MNVSCPFLSFSSVTTLTLFPDRRVQDQGEGPVTCPSAEERHATAYWVTSRFLLDRFSAHGVPHIMRHSSGWRRLFWALVVLGALAILVLQVRATLAEFLEFPKKVTIEVSRLFRRRPAGWKRWDPGERRSGQCVNCCQLRTYALKCGVHCRGMIWCFFFTLCM